MIENLPNKLIHEIRLKNKRSLKKVRTLIYDVAQFRNLLLLFQHEYQRIFNSFLLDQSLIYSMLANKPRVDKYQEKIPMITRILEQAPLRAWIEKLKRQKEKISNTPVVQAVIRQTLKDFKSFFKAVTRYQSNPELFHGRPRPPRPKKLRTLMYSAVEFNRLTFKRVEKTTLLVKIRIGNSTSPKKSVKIKLPPQLENTDISSVRLKMVGTDLYVHLVYSLPPRRHLATNERESENNQRYHAGIDLGLDPLMAIVSDNPGMPSLLISGKELKSFNQWFNKKKAHLQALRDTASSPQEKNHYLLQLKRLIAHRYRRLTNDLHKLTHKIAVLLHETGHETVYIGKDAIANKNGITLGRKTNQQFVSIPYRKLIALLTYKLARHGIEVKEVDESYTSKVSAWSGDIIVIQRQKIKSKIKKPTKEEKVVDSYKGKRIKRGLFKDTTLGKVWHADLNGAVNILKVGMGHNNLSLPLKGFLRKVCNPMRLSLEALLYYVYVKIHIKVSRKSIVVMVEHANSKRYTSRRWIAGSSVARGSMSGTALATRVDGKPHAYIEKNHIR